MANTFINRRILIPLGLILAMAYLVRADDAPNPNRFDNDIVWCQQVMTENQKNFDDLAADSQNADQFTAGDIAMAKKYFEDLNKKWQNVITCFQNNKEADARAAQADAQKMGQRAGRWRERLMFRQRQSDSAPTEDWMTAQRGWTAPEQRPVLTALCETRKKCSEAWGQGAESITPDVDDAVVAKALSDCQLTSARVEIADAELNWARQNHDLLAKRSLSAELEQKVAAVEQTQDEISKLRIEREQLDAKTRALNKERDQRVQNANDELMKALRAQEEAKNRKP